jgi:hypothetical protein
MMGSVLFTGVFQAAEWVSPLEDAEVHCVYLDASQAAGKQGTLMLVMKRPDMACWYGTRCIPYPELCS